MHPNTTPDSTIVEFASDGSKVAPSTSLDAAGYLVNEQLPAEHLNFFLSKLTQGRILYDDAVKSLLTELNNVITQGGGTPNNALYNQLKTALDSLYQAHANGANWQSALAEVLGQGHVPSSSAALAIQSSWNGALTAALGTNWPTALASSGPNGANWISAIMEALGQGHVPSSSAALAINSSWNTILANSIPSSSNMWQGEKVLLTSGSGTWTVPAGVRKIKVICVGGGGAGGTGSSTYGGGGGGGGTIISDILAEILNVTPGASLSYSVGIGGVGNTGGPTSFTGATTRYGGQRGSDGNAGSGGSGGGGSGPGVSGQRGSSGQVLVSSINADACGGSGGGASDFGGGGAGGLGGYHTTNGQNGASGVIIIEY